MSNQIIRNLAVFCLTSATFSVSAAMTASSASAIGIESWELVSSFKNYFLDTFKTPVTPLPSYKLKIQTGGGLTSDNLFNGNQSFHEITYFEIFGTNGLASHTDVSFSPISPNVFLATLTPGQGNPLASLNISSMDFIITRKNSNRFDLAIVGSNSNYIPGSIPNPIPIYASDNDVSFTQTTSVPEPSIVFGLIGLAGLSLKALKQSKHIGIE